MPAQIQTASTLPRPLSSFVGRRDVLANATDLLAANRLLTLTGPGGSGKTRLSIELARAVEDRYPGGAHFVALAAVRDPGLVAPAVAQTLGIQDSRDRPIIEHLSAYLRERETLLVLDNFEQVIDAAPLVIELLATCPQLRVIVTTRVSLRVSGEQELRVPPLALPEPGVPVTARGLDDYEATRLFVVRALARAPQLTLDDRNAAAVVSIVRQLDGLPLAIELAAARVNMMSVESIQARLGDSLSLLVGGSRDLPDRQRTLRSTISWSYDLLSDGARELLAVCAAFRGGMSLADVEAVCSSAAGLTTSPVDAIQELVDHGLLRMSPSGDQTRYTLLEAVREFAAERLAALPSADRIHLAHATVFARLAESVQRPPCWPDQTLLLRLDLEHDNLRAALDWLEVHDAPTALHVAGRLTAYWSLRGHFTESRRRLNRLVTLVPGPSSDRVTAMTGIGWLATDQGQRETAFAMLDESVRLARQVGDRIAEGAALFTRARVWLVGVDIEAGRRDAAAALEILTAEGDAQGIAASLFFAGLAQQFSAEPDAAPAVYLECIARCEEAGLANLRARALQILGIAHLQLGDIASGRAALAEGSPAVLESGDRFGIAVGLGGLIVLAAKTDRPRLALQLAGVLDAFVEVNELVPPMALRELADESLQTARARVGAADAPLRAAGRAMSVEDAVAAALSDEGEQPWQIGAGPPLTRRETEIATLVAQGLTNRQVATRLHLSVRTVDVHVDHVLTKLGFGTRTQLAAWAHEQGLMSGNT